MRISDWSSDLCSSDLVSDRLSDLVSKYFDNAMEAAVVLSREGKGRQIRADISVHVGRGMLMQGRGEADEPYLAFDATLERIAKQLRRYKRRLRGHRKASAGAVAATLQAQQYVLAAGNAAAEEQLHPDGQPVVIAAIAAPPETTNVDD